VQPEKEPSKVLVVVGLVLVVVGPVRVVDVTVVRVVIGKRDQLSDTTLLGVATASLA
jgi:hypothetical protein